MGGFATHSHDLVTVAHVLRKYDPREWGGTETAVHRLLGGLRRSGLPSVVFAPRIEGESALDVDPLRRDGHPVRRFRAYLPTLGLAPDERKRLVAVGGNILSFDAPLLLMREPGVSIVHTHTLNRLGGVARTVARLRRLPLVVTIHGGYLDLPDDVRAQLAPSGRTLDLGKPYGFLVGARRVLEDASAIVTCNPREAELLREALPRKRIVQMPHSVDIAPYSADQRAAAEEAFPRLRGRPLLLQVGRIDPTKNQLFSVEQMPSVRERHRDATLVLVGPATDAEYLERVLARIAELGLEERVLLTGALPSGDPRLVGLLELADVLLLPSLSETFGLVIIEAWAAGTPVLASKTSGAIELLGAGEERGRLFDRSEPEGFHARLDEIVAKTDRTRAGVSAGRRLARERYATDRVAAEFVALYAEARELRR